MKDEGIVQFINVAYVSLVFPQEHNRESNVYRSSIFIRDLLEQVYDFAPLSYVLDYHGSYTQVVGPVNMLFG